MDDDVFWRLVGKLGRDPGDEDFDALVSRLADRPEAEIVGFADRLATVLWSLDTPAHFAAVGSAGDDWFRSVRCAVVAAGRKAYEKVLRKPAALAKFADEEAEPLLTVAGRAFEESTGRLWEHEAPVGYQVGGNTAAWGSALRPVTAAESRPWLSLALGTVASGGAPEAYALLLYDVVAHAGEDPDWQRWWAGSGLRECELSLLLDATGATPPATVFRSGRVRARLEVTHDSAPFPLDDRAGLGQHAVDEIQNLLAVVRARLGLPAMPPLVVPVREDLEDEMFGPPREDDHLPRGLLDLMGH